MEYGIRYLGDGEVKMQGYLDPEWAGSATDKKRTPRCCFRLELAMISWFNKKQASIALSFAEAECMATSTTSCEAIWVRKLLAGLFDLELEPTIIYCDNESCIKLSKNPMFHDRSEHIEIRYHFVRDRVQKGAMKL
jgi:hypothetical protein